MFAFITIGTNNLKRSSNFYNKILKPLKIKKVLSHNRYNVYAKIKSPNKIELYLIKPHDKKKSHKWEWYNDYFSNYFKKNC